MLTLSNITKSFGARTLFENVCFTVNRGERIALVGPNGAGKSTLFSVILETQSPDSGKVILNKNVCLGYLPQETHVSNDETVLELAISVASEIISMRRFMINCEERGEIDTEAYHESRARYAELNGYQLEPQAKRILKGLAFRETDLDRPLRTMSGGWVMRAHLARLLVMEPDLLMLDEPTNHLDLESLGWFQNYLKSYPGAILMISHDRAFLNDLIDGVLEIRSRKIHRYRGNYDSYVEQRRALHEQHLAAYKNQQAEIERLQRFADRFRAKASKASQAQSKLKQIERMEKIDAPERAERQIQIQFPQPARSGERVITLEHIHQAYGDCIVYSGIDLEITRHQRTVLVGPNGAGKSTLLKILAGVLPFQQGKRILGHNVQVGYYSQNRVEMLNPAYTVLQEVMNIPRPVSEVQARTVLGAFLFQGDDVFKKTNVLSGGEKSRLALIKLLLDPPNLLLMDEPTTHLDMASIDALIEALKQYQGTLVFISHDVYFIRALATTVLHISAGRLTHYAGDYSYYLEKTGALSERRALIAGEKLSDNRASEKNISSSSPASSFLPSSSTSIFKTKEQKKYEAEKRQMLARQRKQLEAELQEIEEAITQLEEVQKKITSQLEDPKTYQEGGPAIQLNRELMENMQKLEELNQAWEEILTKINECALQGSNL